MSAVAILLAIVAAVVVAVAVAAAVVVVVRRVRPPSGASGGSGRLARRVQEPSAEHAGRGDRHVDEQAAVWDAARTAGTPSRPVLFQEDLGRPDPRTPDAYDVSELYAPSDAGTARYDDASDAPVDESFDESFDDAVEDTVEDLAATDLGRDVVSAAEEDEADRAFAAELDDVGDEPGHDRFAPRRPPPDQRPSAPDHDEFVSELLGTGDVGDRGGEAEAEAEPAAPSASGEVLERRTPKANPDAYRQPLRLARTQQRPTGASRRSPDQIRSMLLNYRGGMKRGREDPQGGSTESEP